MFLVQVVYLESSGQRDIIFVRPRDVVIQRERDKDVQLPGRLCEFTEQRPVVARHPGVAAVSGVDREHKRNIAQARSGDSEHLRQPAAPLRLVPAKHLGKSGGDFFHKSRTCAAFDAQNFAAAIQQTARAGGDVSIRDCRTKFAESS